ncbi:MAG: HAD family hydrolase [Dokdonella sp.]
MPARVAEGTQPIRAISLDLDDTLWPIAPVIERVERHVDAWLRERCPEVADAWPISAFRALREEVARDHPHLAHDFTEQRKLTLRRAFQPFGLGEEWVESAYEVYQQVRNQVDCYPDALEALPLLASRWPLITISNGNADLIRIGMHAHFAFSISAREAGVAKPDAAIFHAACERLGLPPECVLHIGDDPMLDIEGARDAGMRTAWLNRDGTCGSVACVPDIEIRKLGDVIPWLDSLNGTSTPP